MIQLTQSGLKISDASEVARLRQEFSENHCIVLPALLEGRIIDKILDQLDKTDFFENMHKDSKEEVFATDLTVTGKSAALHHITFVLNNPALFKLVEEITQCTGIKSFAGRVYRNLPDTGHRLDWHDDTEDSSRIVAMSMSLNRQPFSGGVFQLRDKKTKKIFSEVFAGRPGDTHVFRVSPMLEHCVTPTVGAYSRTAAAGWFTSLAPAGLPFLKS
ncbi:MAG: 2OG-Fe(II) oxygenase [Flavobacteriales bacterium]